MPGVAQEGTIELTRKRQVVDGQPEIRYSLLIQGLRSPGCGYTNEERYGGWKENDCTAANILLENLIMALGPIPEGGDPYAQLILKVQP
ncbi:hypothetical protein A3K63_00145 [Candidatus Micrarchaeota archaeon RBG_16_49_10]|nr:MAG: hypothetical protein A3K63_00145 [Candidatus Micrarchaeota archaeon RBG_16_49_10]